MGGFEALKQVPSAKPKPYKLCDCLKMASGLDLLFLIHLIPMGLEVKGSGVLGYVGMLMHGVIPRYSTCPSTGFMKGPFQDPWMKKAQQAPCRLPTILHSLQ